MRNAYFINTASNGGGGCLKIILNPDGNNSRLINLTKNPHIVQILKTVSKLQHFYKQISSICDNPFVISLKR